MEPQGNESGYQRLASSGRFVEAVRLYRRQHGGSLEEAWDAVERIAAPVPADLSGRLALDPAVEGEIDALVRTGQKIVAIKRLREATTLGLKEAKDVIDRHAAELGPVARDPNIDSLQRLVAEAEDASRRGRAQRAASRSGCFIATAAYGDPDALEVLALRRYRDRVLRRRRFGRFMICLYYRLSPPLAASLARSEVARALVRSLLAPVAACCRASLRGRHRPASKRKAATHDGK